MPSNPTACLQIHRTWDGLPAAPDERAQVTLSLDAARLIIEVDAPWHDDPPPPAPPGSLWGLWEHEVVEVFVAGPDARYTEVELGPHGHFLVLQLDGVRQVVARELPLDRRVTRESDRWRAHAALDRALLPPRPWTVNAYAIHGVGARRRHLAAHPVPGAQPDFHRLDCFEPLTL